MRALGSIFGALLALGCSSEAVSGEAPSNAAPSAPAPADTSVPAPTVEGDFAPAANYPPGPYGHGIGAVIENLSFIGWRDPVAAGYDPARLELVELSAFYDPDGAQTELLVINASAVWCTVCQGELRDMKNNGTYEAYRKRKVQVLSTLFQDSNSRPAKPSDLVLWGSGASRAIAFPLVLDPALKMGIYFTSDATPLNLVVDTRTMRIIDSMMGYDPTPGSGMWGRVDRELQSRGL